MSCDTPFETCCEERGTFLYSGTLLDENGAPVTLAALTAFTMDLVDKATGTVLNSRTAVDILNTNGGTFHATTGAFTFRFQAADNVIVTDAKQTERHIATFHATWATGVKHWEVHVSVDNLVSVS